MLEGGISYPQQFMPQGGGNAVPQYFAPQPISAAQPTFGGAYPAPTPLPGGSPQGASDTARQNYLQTVVNPQVAGVVADYGGRGLGNSTFAGSFAAAAQANGAAQAGQVGNQAAEAWANANKANTDASLAPGYLGVSQNNSANDSRQVANTGNYQAGQLGLGQQGVNNDQQKINNQQGQFGQTLGYNYFNSLFGGGF